MEVQVKQEVIDTQVDGLPAISDVFSIKREEPPTENVRADGSHTDLHLLEYEQITIEKFDVDTAVLERERALSSQPGGAGQVKPRYVTSRHEHSCLLHPRLKQ